MERAKNTVFELAFALTSDNKLVGHLDLAAVLVDAIQLMAFAFSPKYNWGVLDIQNFLQYFVLPWPVVQLSFYTVSACVLFAFVSLLLLMKQVASNGVITSVRLLMVTRLVMAVSSTILFFPFLETYLTVFKQFLGYAAPSGDLDGTVLFLSQSIVYVVIFYIIVLTFSVLYIIPDPLESRDLTARITTRPIVLDIFGRTLIVFVQNLTDDPIYLAAVYWAIMSMTLCMTLVYPYYLRQSMNRIKIGLVGALWFLSNFSLHVCTNPQNDITLFVVACVISVLSIPMFMVLADFRFKWIDPRRSGKGKELPASFYKRLYFLPDYELATRVYCSTSVSVDEMLTAVSIFEEGLKRYPQSDYLHARFAIFLVFVMKERLSSLRAGSQKDVDYLQKLDKQVSYQVASIIKKIFRMNPLLDLQYSFFYVAAKLEQEQYAADAGKPRLDIIESIRFKHDIKTALEHHRRANETILSFWKSFGLDQEQRDQLIPYLAQEFYKHSATSEKYYSRLLLQFPNSQYLWDYYIVFVNDVLHDEKRAAQLEQQRKSNHGDSRHGSANQLNAGTSNKSEDNLYSALTQGLGKEQNNRKSAKWHIKSNALWLTMVCNLALLMFAQIFLMIYSEFYYSDLKPSTEVGSMASTRRFGQTTLYLARQAEIFCNHGENYIRNISLDYIQSQIMHFSLQTSLVSFNVKQDPATQTFGPLRDAWNAPIGTQFIRPVPWIKENSSIDAMSFIDAFVSHGVKFASTNLTGCVRDVPLPLDVAGVQPSALVNNSDWTFLVDNAKLEYLLSQFGVVMAVQELHHYKTDTNRTILSVVYACATIIPLLVTIFFVYPAFRTFKWERVAIMKLFLKFDSNCVETIVARRKEAVFNVSRRGPKLSNQPDQQVRSKMSLTSENSVDMTDPSSSGTSKISRHSPLTLMFSSYFVSMCMLLAFMAGMIAIVFQTSLFLASTANEGNWNAARRSLGARMVALSQELIRGDTSVWKDRDEVRSYLRDHFELLSKAHNGLKSGDEELGLPGFAGRYKPQDDIAYVRSCDEEKLECFSLNELYSVYLENIRAILATPDDELSLDLPRFRQSVDMIFGDMGQKLSTSAKLLLEEATPVINDAIYNESIFVALCVPVCLASIVFLTWLRNNINNELDAFRQILNMIPFEYLKMNKEAFLYVKHAKISAKKSDTLVASDGKDKDENEKKTVASDKTTKMIAQSSEFDDISVSGDEKEDTLKTVKANKTHGPEQKRAQFKTGSEVAIYITDESEPEPEMEPEDRNFL